MEILDVEQAAYSERWPTGFGFFDDCIGGGFVRGMIEIAGNESTGKTILAMQMAVHNLLRGGCVKLYDQEDSFAPERIREVTGASLADFMSFNTRKGEQVADIMESRFLPARAESLEEMFADIEAQAKLWREYETGAVDQPIYFILDSLATAETTAEADRGYDKKEYASVAGFLSRNLKKLTSAIHKYRAVFIVINQMRDKVGVMFGEKTSTPGGKAKNFSAVMRVRLSNVKTLPDGFLVKAYTKKNKTDRAMCDIVMPFSFDHGFTDLATAIHTLKHYKLLRAIPRKGYQVKTPKQTIDFPLALPVEHQAKLIKYARAVYKQNGRLVMSKSTWSGVDTSVSAEDTGNDGD
jgi:RecA/RadA recombinase